MRVCVWAVLVSLVFMAGCAGPKVAKVDTKPQPYVAAASTLVPPEPAIHEPAPARQPTPFDLGWEPQGGITRRWRYIVIHHSASDVGSLVKIDQWHKSKGWDGCGYHFVIGNGTFSQDGLIQASPRWMEQAIGAHTRLAARFARDRGLTTNYYNEWGIGIVLVGNFDHRSPSPSQMASLAKLLNYLMVRCQIPESRVVTHGGVDQTHCPGRYFSRTQALLTARAMRAMASAQ
jgi:N-acetylmuramoyl-L-alanine amidase